LYRLVLEHRRGRLNKFQPPRIFAIRTRIIPNKYLSFRCDDLFIQRPLKALAPRTKRWKAQSKTRPHRSLPNRTRCNVECTVQISFKFSPRSGRILPATDIHLWGPQWLADVAPQKKKSQRAIYRYGVCTCTRKLQVQFYCVLNL
jgi:hypothetical protein